MFEKHVRRPGPGKSSDPRKLAAFVRVWARLVCIRSQLFTREFTGVLSDRLVEVVMIENQALGIEIAVSGKCYRCPSPNINSTRLL
jgi:hypothetical protein